MKKVCCKKLNSETASQVDFSTVVIDWYDGPSSAVFQCAVCKTPYRGFLIDWSADHNQRVFALSSFEQKINPSELENKLANYQVHSADTNNDDLQWLDRFGDPIIAVGYSINKDTVVTGVKISESDIESAKNWLLVSDDPVSEKNWHSVLFANV